MSQPTHLVEIEFKLPQSILKQGSPKLRSLIKLCNLQVKQIDNLIIVTLSRVNSTITPKILKLLAAEVRLLGQPLRVNDCEVNWQKRQAFMVLQGEKVAFVASVPVDEQGVSHD